MKHPRSILFFIFIIIFSQATFAQEKEKVMTRAEVIERLSASDFIKKKIGSLLNWGVGYDITKINRTNLAPTIKDILVSPIKVPPDDRTVISLSVKVDDPGGLTNIRGVRADLSSLGRLPNMMLVDNGLWGDDNAGDGVYTLQTSVRINIEKGSKSIPVAVSNLKGWVAIGQTNINVETDPVIVQTFASPNRIRADGSSKVKLGVKVENPGRTEDIRSVKIDLTPLGRDKGSEMYDDGTHGDEKAGDATYYIETAVAAGTNTGEKKIRVEVINFIGGKSSGEIILVVE